MFQAVNQLAVCVSVPDKRMLHFASQAKTLTTSVEAMRGVPAPGDDAVDDVTLEQPIPSTSTDPNPTPHLAGHGKSLKHNHALISRNDCCHVATHSSQVYNV